MKVVTNKSLQSFTVYFSYPSGPRTYWLRPGQSVAVSEKAITGQVHTLQRRRLLEITGA